MSGNHKRKRRDLHVGWMMGAWGKLCNLLFKLKLYNMVKRINKHSSYHYAQRMYELKRAGKLR